MRLSELTDHLSEKKYLGLNDPEISGIAYDSRKIKPGYLFVAVRGFHQDGHSYIGKAVEMGAVAVLLETSALDGQVQAGVANGTTPLVAVPDTRKALADVAARFYDFPARKLKVIGITGTDGKTTTSFLCSHVLETAGFITGLMGTVDFKVASKWWANDTRQSTPESLEIQEMLAEMVNAKVDYAVLETTSHSLVLDRVRKCEYDIAIFTNLTGDHLDFHGTRDQYLKDKSKLFEMLGSSADKGTPKVSIINIDDAAYSTLKEVSPVPPLTYGLNNPADITARGIELSGNGTVLTAVTPVGDIDLNLKLTGSFNVYNALAAVALGVSQHISLNTIKSALESISGVPGRMERIDCGQPFTVIVDYAHTPDSLQKVINVLRPLCEGKLIVVFGCAGERDKSKRPVMGKIAALSTDYFILTNEDPRFEDPEEILREMEAGATLVGRKIGVDYLKIADRRQAIAEAFSRARPGDLVLLAGKGHEGCIIIGNEKTPWDERFMARELLKQLAVE